MTIRSSTEGDPPKIPRFHAARRVCMTARAHF